MSFYMTFVFLTASLIQACWAVLLVVSVLVRSGGWVGGWMGGWVGGWQEKWGLKLISTQVVVEVEVGVELGNITF